MLLLDYRPGHAGQKERRQLELELQQRELISYEPILNTALAREETMEMIVPDAYPDIFTVLDTSGVALLGRKELSAGCAILTGTIRSSILYQPEGGGPVQVMAAEIPFQLKAEEERIATDGSCVASLRLTLLETRALNPRKVLIRAEIVADVMVYQKTFATYCAEIENRESQGVEQRLTDCQGCFVRQVAERPFQFSDVLNLPGNKPAIDTVLRAAVRIFSTEEKPIGEKLVFKGNAAVQLLYRSVEGTVAVATFDLPFSQMVDTAGGGEGCVYQLTLSLLGYELGQLDEEGRSLSLDLDLLAQAIVRENLTVQMVSDAYSIRYAAAPEFTQYHIPRLVSQNNRRFSLRELVEAPAEVREVLSAELRMGQLHFTRQEHQLNLRADLRVSIVYEDTHGEVGAVSQTFPMHMALDAPQDCTPYVAFAHDDTSGMVTAGGLEIRSDLEFQILLMGEETMLGLASLQVNSDTELDYSGKPSIVLRQFHDGETLWEIAKAYCTTCAEIERANELQDGGAAVGQMLLIPRKR